jgi:hypothetical protein
MTMCPQCGGKVGRGQRICRACGAGLDAVPESSFLTRLLRRLFGGLRVNVSGDAHADRLTISMRRVVPGGREVTAAEPVSAELLREVEGTSRGSPSGDESVKVRSVGPVQVTTRTVTHRYHSLDEMPPELRERAAAALKGGTVHGVQSSTAITLEINGERRSYSRVEDVPEPYRQAVERARQQAGSR